MGSWRAQWTARRIGAAIEDGQFSDRTAGAFDAQHLLPAAGGTLEDPDVAGFDHVEPGAGFALFENEFARRELAPDSPLGKETQLAFGELGKQRSSCEHKRGWRAGHAGHCTEAKHRAAPPAIPESAP